MNFLIIYHNKTGFTITNDIFAWQPCSASDTRERYKKFCGSDSCRFIFCFCIYRRLSASLTVFSGRRREKFRRVRTCRRLRENRGAEQTEAFRILLLWLWRWLCLPPDGFLSYCVRFPQRKTKSAG